MMDLKTHLFINQHLMWPNRRQKNPTRVLNILLIIWKSTGLHNSKLKVLRGAFVPKVKYYGTKMGLQFTNTPKI